MVNWRKLRSWSVSLLPNQLDLRPPFVLMRQEEEQHIRPDSGRGEGGGKKREAKLLAEYRKMYPQHEDVWKNWTSADARLAIKKELGMMKKTAFIINTSRGPIINEKDLIPLSNDPFKVCESLMDENVYRIKQLIK